MGGRTSAGGGGGGGGGGTVPGTTVESSRPYVLGIGAYGSVSGAAGKMWDGRDLPGGRQTIENLASGHRRAVESIASAVKSQAGVGNEPFTVQVKTRKGYATGPDPGDRFFRGKGAVTIESTIKSGNATAVVRTSMGSMSGYNSVVVSRGGSPAALTVSRQGQGVSSAEATRMGREFSREAFGGRR